MHFQSKNNTLQLHVKVIPNASRTTLAGLLGDSVKIKVAQPPEDGKANRAVEELLAKILGLARSQVTVIAGQSNPRKTIQITGLAVDTAESRLQIALVDAANKR